MQQQIKSSSNNWQIGQTILRHIGFALFGWQVPFLLQDELIKRGAECHKAILAFVRYIKVDERLVTGQNPQSARKVGKKVVEEMFDK